MPRHNLTRGQNLTVAVEQGEILQIKSGSIEIKNNIHVSDPASFVFRGHTSAITFNDPKTIWIRCESQSAIIDLIKGL